MVNGCIDYSKSVISEVLVLHGVGTLRVNKYFSFQGNYDLINTT